MPQTRVRVVGSGFTTFSYRGKPIAFLEGFRDSGQQPFGQGGNLAGGAAEAIHPLGSRTPVEIASSRVLSAGTITATIKELWNEPVWYQLAGLAGRANLVDVWEAMAADPTSVTCQMLIRPPAPGSPTRGKVYHGCVITGIPNDETVAIGALSVNRDITIAYTHTTKVGR